VWGRLLYGMTDWTEPGVMTDPGEYAYLFDDLPSDVPGLFRAVQGLMIHEFWAAEYGVTLPDEPPRGGGWPTRSSTPSRCGSWASGST
jgi:hypothetical protein